MMIVGIGWPRCGNVTDGMKKGGPLEVAPALCIREKVDPAGGPPIGPYTVLWYRAAVEPDTFLLATAPRSPELGRTATDTSKPESDEC
jgi:hypothetical protein